MVSEVYTILRMKTIEKKAWPETFELVMTGKKRFDVRLNDVDIEEGDSVLLREWNPNTKEYTGREIEVVATYIFKTKGQPFWSDTDVDAYGFQVIQFDTKKKGKKK